VAGLPLRVAGGRLDRSPWDQASVRVKPWMTDQPKVDAPGAYTAGGFQFDEARLNREARASKQVAAMATLEMAPDCN